MSNDIKLLPCPFCGEKAEIINHRSGEYAVECTNCYGKTHRSVTEKLAIERWNTRKPIDRIAEQLEELKHDNPMVTQNYIMRKQAIEIVKECEIKC